jgi:peptide/nickel transport system substrate-binding protein
MRPVRLILAAFLVCSGVSTAQARDLVMGASTEPSSIDPQFSRNNNNQNIAMQMFDRLVSTNATIQMKPALAVSWTNVDPLTWRVKLRGGVKFHDGNLLTADDVIFSLTRAKNIPNSPAPFSGNVAAIAGMTAIDPLTIEFKTKSPTPDFIEQIGFVYILEKAVAENAAIADFNSGKAAIGTGAYKFVEYASGDHITMQRNPDFWGDKQDFDRVTVKFIASDANRIAALRSGSVDLIDAVSPRDVEALSGVSGIKLFPIASARLIYLALDSVRDQSPFVTDKTGKPLATNPLKDARVRKALSLMIPRDLMVKGVLKGAGEPAGQLVPAGVTGYDPSIEVPPYDLAAAKQLLTEAGVPDGFGLTIHTSNGRFANDADIAQAVGQMFTRGGIKVNGVVAQPYNVYLPNASKGDFSAFVVSIGNTSPTSATNLRNLLMTVDPDSGAGVFNRTHYSNPAFDAAIKTAMAEFDPARRIEDLQKATKLVFADTPVIPLYWPKIYWAGKADLNYAANMSEDFTAADASIAKQ